MTGEVDAKGDAEERVGEGFVSHSHSCLRRAGGEPSYILLVESRRCPLGGGFRR
jgi:hypothetical protein